ncbi:MAG: poly(3-hydroxyalkanoate) depolymerase [Alphaproteobacteria bacterium]|nr:poly(3-hydroxyalkanoate) depolymerase [Alphaproteobacteria bacterium]
MSLNTDQPVTVSEPFTDIRTVDVDGCALRVGLRRGDGTPLVIFNGLGANLELLGPFVAALAGLEIVAFDAPGAGGSPAPLLPYRYSQLAVLVDRLLTQLDYDGPVDVLGISWGGALAQQYAYLHPDRCRKLVLAATSPGVVMVPGRLSALSKLLSPRRYREPGYLRRVAPELYGGAFRRQPDLIDRHIRHLQAPHGRGYLYQMAAMWGWSSLPWLHRVRQPTLIMAGTEDPIVPAINAKILAALIPRSEFLAIDDGHLFLVTSADEVAPRVKQFLA